MNIVRKVSLYTFILQWATLIGFIFIIFRWRYYGVRVIATVLFAEFIFGHERE